MLMYLNKNLSTFLTLQRRRSNPEEKKSAGASRMDWRHSSVAKPCAVLSHSAVSDSLQTHGL